jgi:uncharacterized membrane protein (GlpM family)
MTLSANVFYTAFETWTGTLIGTLSLSMMSMNDVFLTGLISLIDSFFVIDHGNVTCTQTLKTLTWNVILNYSDDVTVTYYVT